MDRTPECLETHDPSTDGSRRIAHLGGITPLPRADQEPPGPRFRQAKMSPHGRSTLGGTEQLNRWPALQLSRRPTSHRSGLEPCQLAHVTAHRLYALPGANVSSVPPHRPFLVVVLQHARPG